MANTRSDDRTPPPAERGTRREGAPVGGIASTADAGLGAGRQDAKSGSGSASRPGSEPHEIDEPRDEGPIESLGRSVGEVVLGSDEEDRKARERGR
jgi:hypothetical protein